MWQWSEAERELQASRIALVFRWYSKGTPFALLRCISVASDGLPKGDVSSQTSIDARSVFSCCCNVAGMWQRNDAEIEVEVSRLVFRVPVVFQWSAIRLAQIYCRLVRWDSEGRRV